MPVRPEEITSVIKEQIRQFGAQVQAVNVGTDVLDLLEGLVVVDVAMLDPEHQHQGLRTAVILVFAIKQGVAVTLGKEVREVGGDFDLGHAIDHEEADRDQDEADGGAEAQDEFAQSAQSFGRTAFDFVHHARGQTDAQ